VVQAAETAVYYARQAAAEVILFATDPIGHTGEVIADQVRPDGPPPSDAAVNNAPGLRHRNVWAILGLFVITLHCYAFYWYVDTTRALNRRTMDKISSGFMALCIGMAVVAATLTFTLKVAGNTNLPGWFPTAAWALNAMDCAFWLAWTLRLRHRFNDHVSAVKQPEFSASLLWSWLFQMFYLQFKINQVVDERLVRRAAPV
jgi:hypothetical protein